MLYLGLYRDENTHTHTPTMGCAPFDFWPFGVSLVEFFLFLYSLLESATCNLLSNFKSIRQFHLKSLDKNHAYTIYNLHKLKPRIKTDLGLLAKIQFWNLVMKGVNSRFVLVLKKYAGMTSHFCVTLLLV